MTTSDFLNKIDDMIFYEDDYDIWMNLLNNAEDKFFVKVLEEILEGNLYISDFKRIFAGSSYEELIRQNILNQDKLTKELSRLIAFRNSTDDGLDFSSRSLGIAKPDMILENNALRTIYDNVLNDIKEDALYQLLATVNTDSEIIRQAKLRIFNAVKDGIINKEELLLFVRSFIIPIDYRYQTLDISDKNFMLEHNLTEDEMKKMKALAIFMRTKGA